MLVRRGDRGDEVREVQQTLRDLGFDIEVDGIFGPMTEAAVKQFQRDNGLVADGIVGPNTRAAFNQATQPRQPAGGVDLNGLRAEIVRIAREERDRWQGQHETSPAMTPVLQDYYATGVNAQISAANLQDPDWQDDHPWSAVFISWVMRTAGAGDAFAYSRAHQVYTAAAKRNREAGDADNPFWAYRITEHAPEAGDLVCTARANSGANYDNIDEGFRASHCDIVVDVQPGQISAIGGNVSNRVGQKTLNTDDQGFVSTNGNQQGYFAVIHINDGE